MNEPLPIQIISIIAAISCASITIGMSVGPALFPFSTIIS